MLPLENPCIFKAFKAQRTKMPLLQEIPEIMNCGKSVRSVLEKQPAVTESSSPQGSEYRPRPQEHGLPCPWGRGAQGHRSGGRKQLVS